MSDPYVCHLDLVRYDWSKLDKGAWSCECAFVYFIFDNADFGNYFSFLIVYR